MLNQLIWVFLLSTQLAFASSNPELKVLRRTIAYAGQRLTQDEFRARVSRVFAEYGKTAKPEGQFDRMEQALMEMGYDPARAKELVADARAFASQTKMNGNPSVYAQSFANEAVLLSLKYPSGAQFSSCDLSWVIGIAGGITALGGAFVWGLGSNLNMDKYGNSLPDPKMVRLGQIILGAGALGMIDAIVIHAFAPDKSCD